MELNKVNNTHKVKPFLGYGRVSYVWNGVVFPILVMIAVFGQRHKHGHFHV